MMGRHSVTGPRCNDMPTLVVDGDSPLVSTLMECGTTSVFVTVEKNQVESIYHVDTFTYEYDQGKYVGIAELRHTGTRRRPTKRGL